MSYSITIEVDEKGDAEVVGISRGPSAQPPAGRYSIGGHVHREGDSASSLSSLSLSTPSGGLAGHLSS